MSASLDLPFHRLREVRLKLLRLHKALLFSERETYEQHFGAIRSTGEFFQLVVSDEWFSWLRPFSQFIAQIDETLSSREPATLQQASDLLHQARELLKANETGSESEQRYYHAIQRDPNIAFMHAEVTQLLRADSLN